MASNGESGASGAGASSSPSSQLETNETSPPGSQAQQGNEQQVTTFSHPGARIIAQRAIDGDGPYRCRKCGNAVLTVSVPECPACQDKHPWFAQDEELAQDGERA